MFRRIPKLTRIIAVGALTAGLVGAMVPAGRAAAVTFATDLDGVAAGVQSVVPNPATAGVAAQYTIAFELGAAGGNAIVEDSGQFVITFPAGTTVPSTIAAASIIVNGTPASGNGTNAVPPAPPLVNGRVVTITSPVAVAASGVVTVIFSQSAGILNPGLAGAAYTVMVATASNVTPEAAAASPAYSITRSLSVSPTSGIFGTSVTATGRGFVANSTATVWIDLDDDGVQDAGEQTLGSATVGADNTFTGTFSALSTSGFVAGANQINAKDGSGAAVDPASNPEFTVLSRVTVSPTSGNIGSTITVTVSAGTAGDAVADVTLGGIIANPDGTAGTGVCDAADTAALSGTGGATYTCTVPAGSAIGVQTLSVDVTTGTDPTTTFTVTAVPLTVAPSTVVPNQTITITGTGFAPSTVAGGAGPNGVHQILGGIAIGGTAVGGITYPVNLDSGGNLVVQGTVPTVAPLLTAGAYTLNIADDTGRIGQATVTVPSRSATLSPTSSGRGTTLMVSGAGFAGNSTVTVMYAGVVQTTVATDASGNYSGSFTVPIGTGIPSSNTVTVTSSLTGSTATATHSGPTSSITVNQTSIAAGGTLNITGKDFPAFSTVTAVSIGGINALPGNAPASDANGALTLSILVPQVPLGTNAVIVTAGGSTASGSVTVTQAPQTVQTSFAPLGTNLVRVWAYDPTLNNGQGGFRLYDPAAAGASDLSTLTRGQGYWVRVNTAQTVTLGSFQYTLSPGWNLIGWQG